MQVVKRDSRHGGIWLAGNAKRGSKSRHCAPFACCWRLVRAGTVKFGWQATQRGAASLDTARLLRAADQSRHGGIWLAGNAKRGSKSRHCAPFACCWRLVRDSRHGGIWQAMQRGAASLDTARLLRAAGGLSYFHLAALRYDKKKLPLHEKVTYTRQLLKREIKIKKWSRQLLLKKCL